MRLGPSRIQGRLDEAPRVRTFVEVVPLSRSGCVAEKGCLCTLFGREHERTLDRSDGARIAAAQFARDHAWVDGVDAQGGVTARQLLGVP